LFVSEEEKKESPLREEHERMGARMMVFAGWNMPVQYAGIRQEHEAVREAVGIFDISHMGQIYVVGPGAGEWLNGMLTNNTAKLAVGEGQYTIMCNERGGVIDDLILYREGEEEWLLVVNASMCGEDLEWLRRHLPAGGVELRDESADWAGMAVQGPASPSLWRRVAECGLPERNGIARHAIGGDEIVLCRTGYTGEDGFEIFVSPAENGGKWWRELVDAGAFPCGLGARDTLRLEVGYPLNGADLSPENSPIEAGLKMFVDFEKGEFVGRDVLVRQQEHGCEVSLRALRAGEKTPPLRPGYALFYEGREVGRIASGTLSPSLGYGIGMGYLPFSIGGVGTRLSVDVRGREFPCEIVKKPFYRPSE